MKILRFHAAWCGPCKMSEPHWNKFIEAYPEVKTESIDIDEHPEIAEKYGVMSIPTLVVTTEEGEERTKRVGAFSFSTLESLVNM